VHVRPLLSLAAAGALSAMWATGLSAQAQAPQAPQVTVSGVSYLQYLYQLKDTANHNNNFDVTRAYINVLGRFSGGVSTRITADIQRVGGGDNSLRYRLKYAFVAYTPQNLTTVSPGVQSNAGGGDGQDLARAEARRTAERSDGGHPASSRPHQPGRSAPHGRGGASDAGAGASGMGRAVTPRNLSCGKVLRSVGAIDVLQCSSDIFALHHVSGRRIESGRRGAEKP